MKKSIFLCVFAILCWNCSSSQSKEETEQWILSKLRTYIAPFEVTFYDSYQMANGGYVDKDYSFVFNNGSLVISYTERRVKPVNKDDVKRDADIKEIKKQATIPIYAIKKIEKNGEHPVFIDKTIKTADEVVIRTESEQINEEEVGSLAYKVPAIRLNLLNDVENDLAVRLQKAFLYLKKFYSAPVRPKEIF